MTDRITAAAKVMMKEYLEAEGNPDIATLNEAFEQVARSMDDEGLLAPELPEPNKNRHWQFGNIEFYPADRDGEVMLEVYDESDYYTDGATTTTIYLGRDIILALLAAADYSEKEVQQ